MAQLTTALVPRRSVSFKLKAYLALTKPRIIELLLVTTLPTMVVAAKGIPSWWLIVATLVGGALSAGGANAANMFVDRDIDAVMHRTRQPASRHRSGHAGGGGRLRGRARELPPSCCSGGR